MMSLIYYLICRANDNGVVYVSFKEIQTLLGLSRQRYRSILKELVATAEITANSTANSTALRIGVSANKPKPTTAKKTATATTEITANNLPAPQPRDPNEIDFDVFLITFNDLMKGTAIPQIRLINDKRKQTLNARVAEYNDKHALMNVMQKTAASDFLSGRKTGWHADFDWIFKKENFLKILEGTYDNRTDNANAQSSGRGQHRAPDALDLAREILGESARRESL